MVIILTQVDTNKKKEKKDGVPTGNDDGGDDGGGSSGGPPVQLRAPRSPLLPVRDPGSECGAAGAAVRHPPRGTTPKPGARRGDARE